MNTPISHPDRVYIGKLIKSYLLNSKCFKIITNTYLNKDFTYNEENKLAAGSAKMEMDENAQ